MEVEKSTGRFLILDVLNSKKKDGQFHDEFVKIENGQMHCVKGDSVRGTIIIVCVVSSYFVSDRLI